MFSVRTILFYEDEIKTWVTDEPAVVSRWIREVECFHRRKLGRLIVGLDTEWCPSSKSNSDFDRVATLQLCVGHKCLIFQLLHARYIPESLFVFLANANYTFVGVGVDEDARKLTNDYGLDVSCTIDIRGLAVRRLRNDLWGYKGLKKLSKEILHKELEKPKEITLSRWNNKALTDRQIEYGCLDAFASFELGRVLRASLVNRVFDGWCVRIDESFLFREDIYP
ncbi:3'-5' exonuclease-like [Syzygium oleosum]|uniref:3'-5' exonuclease-like n=1 Tax=Syzygium oleosum TaxID=219896 RepID=UPI0011D1DBE5|nr:3'-5' exonuclease-like [Syzygium oleosum]